MGLIGRLRQWQGRIAVRYTIFLASLLVVFAVEFTSYTVVQSNRAIRDELDRHVSYLGRFGADLVNEDLQNLKLRDLLETMRNFAARSDIVYARLLDTHRRIVTDGVGSTVAFTGVSRDDLFDAAMAANALRIGEDGGVLGVAQPILIDGKPIGVLRFGVDLTSTKAAIDDMVRRNVIVAVLFLALALPLTALASRHVAVPIRRLTQATRRIAAGDLSTRIEVRGHDEIAELGRSVSTMVHNLSESAAAIRSLTFVDQLTGLPNRDQLEQRVAGALAAHDEAGDAVLLAIVDLDRFRRVNDALGPDQGDRLLRQVAERLSRVLEDWRDGTTRRTGAAFETALARLSADEFAAMIAGPLADDAVDAVLRSVTRAFEEDFDLDGHRLDVRASVGVALAPADAHDFKSLIQTASVAVDAAKTAGGGTFRFFSADLDARAYRHLMLETELRQAVGRGELEVYYQPQVSCADGRGIGGEALVRWNHPTRGLVYPAEFVPLAEDTGLIVEIGTFVLRRVCAQGAVWAGRGLFPRLSVNVSRAQFQRQDFPALVLQILGDSGLSPSQLELEITESIAMSDPASVIAQIKPLRAAGVRFAMDDFGTGYSSLSTLTRLPFDALKIDRSFVTDITAGGEERRVLVRTVLAMAKGLDLEVVAEGVETSVEYDFLREQHCSTAQGWLFGKALPAVRFETWFITHRRRDARALQDRLRAALVDLPDALRA